jgi:hypothetical protein
MWGLPQIKLTNVTQGLFGASQSEIASSLLVPRPFEGEENFNRVLKGLGMRLKLTELYQSRL